MIYYNGKIIRRVGNDIDLHIPCETNEDLKIINEQNAGVISRQETEIRELKKENTDLKITLEYLSDSENNFKAVCGKLENEKDELKDALRSIQQMDKEEPWEQYEELRKTCIDLENEISELKECKRRQDDETESANTELFSVKCENRRLKELNEELKDALRSIHQMDKEEPWEKTEELRNACIEFEKQADKANDELLTEKQLNSTISATLAQLEYEKNVLEGRVVQANEIIDKLLR